MKVYFINSRGEVSCTGHYGSEQHQSRVKWGNAFETKEEAQKVINLLKGMADPIETNPQFLETLTKVYEAIRDNPKLLDVPIETTGGECCENCFKLSNLMNVPACALKVDCNICPCHSKETTDVEKCCNKCHSLKITTDINTFAILQNSYCNNLNCKCHPKAPKEPFLGEIIDTYLKDVAKTISDSLSTKEVKLPEKLTFDGDAKSITAKNDYKLAKAINQLIDYLKARE